MAFAISIKTESCDNYLIIIDGQPTIDEISKAIEDEMDEEINYISEYMYKATYEISESFSKKIIELFLSFGE